MVWVSEMELDQMWYEILMDESTDVIVGVDFDFLSIAGFDNSTVESKTQWTKPTISEIVLIDKRM